MFTINDKQALRLCFSLMDLTSLHNEDTPSSVAALTKKTVDIPNALGDYPYPASICVFPNLANTVRENLAGAPVHVTAVSSCFPTAQSFLDVKALECRRAVENGADEIDIVLALNKFLSGDYDGAKEEIIAMRAAVDEAGRREGRRITLKVILETGLLKTEELIRKASLLAMEAGADFIKTSTGKVEVNATPFSAEVMCRAIGDFHSSTGRKVGFKAAGGISTAEDALVYLNIVNDILGAEWLCKDLLRFGVSRLGNNLASAIQGENVKYF